jgi:hypothetical protein
MKKTSKKVSLKTRVHGIYSAMTKRFGPKYWKSGKREGSLREPGQNLPFGELELLAWMEERFPGGSAHSCPFCRVPIDAFICTLDHAIPISRGGLIGLVNIDPVCPLCNALKGEMTPIEYRSFLDWMEEQHPAAQADIVKRLRTGGMGMRLRYYRKGQA